MYYNGQWGTVCDDGWNLAAAQVVCRELNFGPAVGVRYNAYYGQGSGQIWLDNLRCNGTELTIKNCSHLPFGVHNCFHRDDVGVKCSPAGVHTYMSVCMYINFDF